MTLQVMLPEPYKIEEDEIWEGYYPGEGGFLEQEIYWGKEFFCKIDDYEKIVELQSTGLKKNRQFKKFVIKK